MKSFQRCTRCVMDNSSDRTIIFNNEGFCNYCSYAMKRMPNIYYPNESGLKKLDVMLNEIKIKSKNNKFDCIMGISGGLDSSYLLYLGYKWGLRILAFHIDDGFNTKIAEHNIENLCKKSGIDLVIEKPDKDQFSDVTKAFMIAGLPGICNPQDNIIISYLYKNAKKYGIKYFLSGANFSLESILQRGNGTNASDGYHIKKISEKFGTKGVDKLPLVTLFERYIKFKYTQKLNVLRPLDYIDYNKESAIKELSNFCSFNYYGGKHYENTLTHFAQVYYLPKKFNIDKRTSHLSSLIISGQMSRAEAIAELGKPLYNKDYFDNELDLILTKLNFTRSEFDRLMVTPPKKHSDYPRSYFNNFANLARMMRKYLSD